MSREPTVTPTSPLAVEFRGANQTRSPLGQPLTRAKQRATSSSSIATLEQSVFQQINQYRRQKGLAPLSRNATINQQARQHSQNMANSRTLSHNGFSTRIQVIGRTIAYKSAAENVAYNAGFSNPAAQAVNGWLKSSGHLQNIMGNYNLTGVGVAKNSRNEFYFTQIFIRR
jgi:uncharacterized protein YkwD